ncbi:MAG: glycosyltransferase family 4 protein [Acidobacteria bacterium]|nr:glycosyltransferase family 4 protein [Acidobacteriota bacterium]
MIVRRKILHFAQAGDTSGFFPQLARWHQRERYEMYFGTLNPIEPSLRQSMESAGVRCFSCDCGSRPAYPLGMVRLARFLRRNRIDVLHTHLFEPSVIGLTAGRIAGARVLVMTRHYSDYHTRIDKHWHVRLDCLCTRLAHRVIAVSRHTAEHMTSVEGAPASKIRVVLNGIDFDRVRVSDPAAPPRIRNEFASDGSFLLLVVGRLHPEKGYTHLFQALPAIRARASRPVIVLVAGAGPFLDRYRAEVASLGCADIVRFLGFRSDVADLIAASDVMVLPSVAEAFGLALTEALHLGTPVVATRVGGIPEIVDDGLDGVLVPGGDHHALSEAIGALLNDPERRRRLVGAGRAKVATRFAFERMVRSYEQLYDELTAGSEDRVLAGSLGHHPGL